VPLQLFDSLQRDGNVNKHNRSRELFGSFVLEKRTTGISRVTRAETNTPRWVFHWWQVL